MHIACICRREARGSVCECVFVNLLCVSWSSHVMYLCVLSVVHSLSHWRAANDTRHTHSCSCTQTYKNTQIYVDANAHTPFGHAHERVHFNSRFQRRRVNAGLIFFLLIIFFPPNTTGCDNVTGFIDTVAMRASLQADLIALDVIFIISR